jgi:hypothetical protein
MYSWIKRESNLRQRTQQVIRELKKCKAWNSDIEAQCMFLPASVWANSFEKKPGSCLEGFDQILI